ncbi:hypothetical protein Peur_006476 [Populus x canadensis]
MNLTQGLIAQTLRTMEKSAVKGQTKGVINSRQIKAFTCVGFCYELILEHNDNMKRIAESKSERLRKRFARMQRLAKSWQMPPFVLAFPLLGSQQFVKDMLQDLCVYNKGSNQGSYELKPEFKKASEEPVPEKIIVLLMNDCRKELSVILSSFP